MTEEQKQRNIERNLRTQDTGEKGLEYLKEAVGLNDDQIRSLVKQIREECPNLNTKKKAVARLMNSLRLFRDECKGICRAQDRYNSMIGLDGQTPPSIAHEKRPRLLKKSGLDKYIERQEKAGSGSSLEGRRWLPTPAEIDGEQGEYELQKLIRGIASEEAPFHEKQLAQLLLWGAILTRAANGRKNKRK